MLIDIYMKFEHFSTSRANGYRPHWIGYSNSDNGNKIAKNVLNFRNLSVTVLCLQQN